MCNPSLFSVPEIEIRTIILSFILSPFDLETKSSPMLPSFEFGIVLPQSPSVVGLQACTTVKGGL